MANERFQEIPKTTTLADLAKHNWNWDKANAELTNLQNQITAEQQARVNQAQAHISAIAAHAASSITLNPVTGLTASTVQAAVEQLRTMLTTIIAGPAPSAAEIQAARVGADNIARASLDILIKEIHAKLLSANNQTVALKHGLNVVTADEAGPVALTLRGNTLVNIPGKAGRGDDASPSLGWTQANGNRSVDTTTVLNPFTSSIKTVSATASSEAGPALDVVIDSSKYYLAAAFIEKGTSTSARLIARLTTWGTIKNGVSTTESGWKFHYVKLAPSDLAGVSPLRLHASGWVNAVGNTVYVCGLRLYEIDAVTYAKIDVDPDYTGDKLAERYPYVDGVKHVVNPIITKVGKNQLNGSPDYTHANATLIEPYKLTLIATASGQNSTMRVKVVAGQQYTVSATVTSTDGRVSIRQADAAGVRTLVGHITATLGSFAFTASATTVELEVDFNALNAGTVGFEKWQLEFGGKTPFEPQNNDYLYVPATLAGYGGVYDSLTVRGTEATVLRRSKTGVAIDGTYSWTMIEDYTGFKRFASWGALGLTSDMPGKAILTKPNGNIAVDLSNNGGQWGIDVYNLQADTNGGLKLAVSDSDTGFGETYTPSTGEIQAFFKGWKMNNGAFGTPYNGTGTKTWTAWNASSNTGGVTTLPTTMATGYTPYMLSYQLATPVTEVVQVEGSLANHAGPNLYEVGEGVVIREKVTPTISGQSYFINASVTSKTSQRPSRILGVYKKGVTDIWNLRARLEGDSGIPGSGYGYAWILSSFFDTTADYTVTYLAQDKYTLTAPLVDASMEYATSSKMVQDLLVQRMADVEMAATISTNAIVQIYARLKAMGA